MYAYNSFTSTFKPEYIQLMTFHIKLCKNNFFPFHSSNYYSVDKSVNKLTHHEFISCIFVGIVLGVFILCWLPFFVTNILMGVCPDTCISDMDLVGSIVTWLGWLNSGE